MDRPIQLTQGVIRPAPTPRHHHRDPRGRDAAGVSASCLEAWPAAGGGLLIGAVVPVLQGSAPIRGQLKTLFLRIDTRALPTVIVPYVRLELHAARAAARIVAAELRIASAQLTIDSCVAGSVSDAHRSVARLCADGRIGFAILAAVARSLLTTAAAERWRVAAAACAAKDGLVTGSMPRRSACYGELASEAALLALPNAVSLAAGKLIRLNGKTAPCERQCR